MESHSCQCIQRIYLHLLLEWKDDCFEVINAPFLSTGFFGRVSVHHRGAKPDGFGRCLKCLPGRWLGTSSVAFSLFPILSYCLFPVFSNLKSHIENEFSLWFVNICSRFIAIYDLYAA